MKRFRGTVRGKVVVLEEGVRLPDGTEVEVRIPGRRRDPAEAFRRVLENPIRRFIGIDELIEEDKRDREERCNLDESGDQ